MVSPLPKRRNGFWGGNSVVTLYLTSREAFIIENNEVRARVEYQALEAGQADVREALKAALSGRRRWRDLLGIDVRLSGGLAKPLCLGPWKGLRDWREAELLGKRRVEETYGSAGDWELHFARWPSPHPVRGAAVKAGHSRFLLESNLHCKVRSITPVWALCEAKLKGFMGSSDVLLVSELDGASVVFGQPGTKNKDATLGAVAEVGAFFNRTKILEIASSSYSVEGKSWWAQYPAPIAGGTTSRFLLGDAEVLS
jgi:hypothetical protein